MPQNLLAEKSVQLKKENDHLEGTICIDLETVRLWDNHDPYLYHAYVELKAEDGSLVEVIPYDIGFGRIEIIDKIIYLNGKRLVITGVNRHEWNPKTGRCIGLEDMRADIACMLRNNINSVRTCHYPDQIPWYYMCDNAGIQTGRFAFSCLPYTASEIENALHHEELPPARRTVLCVYGAVRGVGGIDSWGSIWKIVGDV